MFLFDFFGGILDSIGDFFDTIFGLDSFEDEKNYSSSDEKEEEENDYQNQLESMTGYDFCSIGNCNERVKIDEYSVWISESDKTVYVSAYGSVTVDIPSSIDYSDEYEYKRNVERIINAYSTGYGTTERNYEYEVSKAIEHRLSLHGKSSFFRIKVHTSLSIEYSRSWF